MRGAQYQSEPTPAPPVLIWSLYSGFTSFLAISLLGIIQIYGPAIHTHNLPFAIAPAGASAVLLFAVPSSPLSQPRTVVMSHVISAQVGVFMYEAFKHADESLVWLSGALAVGLAVVLMGLLNCYHPPAGATAYLAGFFSADVKRVGWWFPLYPVLPVSLVMVTVAVVVNNVCRVYPLYWITSARRDPVEKEAEEPVAATVVDQVVNSRVSNELDTEQSWVVARIHQLELELQDLRSQTHNTKTK
ncbi:hypothetical protein LPJ66_004526 [Kickxella alabastrina]|uniref:Uncharacterized protein n=1 Tax=Kickxella alabastrina TaxID=61397 RepID=A0ACC1IL39_9FUNG|nr:hypothetical protein LPJ66_004526 [Kickxella alabastrina]